MERLTQKDNNGKWCLKGVPWEKLHVGERITNEIWERLYGSLFKLMRYEDTGLTPDEINDLNDFNKSQISHLLKELGKERKKHAWIPEEERLPETNDYVLMSFENFTIPLVGRYESDEDGGGAWYLGDCDEKDTCVSNNLFVNAWMTLPEPYKTDSEEK